ncbi:MAG TPA: acyl-CoA dehydrogenase family protein [Mycobacteriales bacterium]|jgi:alkylation response protein AidB-like acyl-CoA dehydrogenase
MTETPQVSERQARTLAEESRDTEWRKPSFGKELFLGRFRPDLIHPHPRPRADDVERGEAFLARLEAFCRTEVDPREIERTAKVPDRVVKGLADLGALGMKIDVEYGGLGLSQLYYNRALAMVGQAHAALATLLSAHQSIGLPQPLKFAGTEEQRRTYLPRCAKDEISAFLLTEPDVGSDPARMHSTAVPTEDGSGYVLNGTKLWTTNGVVASLLIVMATVPKSPGHRGGISAFIVESSSPGVEVLHRNAFMGLRGIENGVTRFTDVRIPAENLVGEEGRGLRIALTTLNTGRLSLPAICAGTAKWSAMVAREWGAGRIQWGHAVGEHEAVAKKIAYITSMAFALEAVVDMSSLMADEDRNDIRIEAALAKLYCSEHGWRLVDDLVQIRGGRGYETADSLAARGERPLAAEQALRDMRINRIFEGSSEIMRLIIAREAVDAHLAVAGDIIDPDKALSEKARGAAKAGGFYAKWLPTLAVGHGDNPRAFAEFGSLAGHLRFVERSSRKLARSTFWGMSRWQGRLEKKQGFLGRLVDIGAELFAMSAVVCRAQMMLDDDPADRWSRQGPDGPDRDSDGQRAVELADLFCKGARRRIDALFHELWANDDAAEYVAAQQVMAGRYRFVEDGLLDLSDPNLPLIAEGGGE